MATIVPNPPSFNMPQDENQPRAAPRRTYGKRAVTPPPVEEEPGRSVFSVQTESPSKNLLSRWTGNGESWKSSLLDLGSEPTSDPPSDPPSPKRASIAGPSRMRPKLTDFAKEAAPPVQDGGQSNDEDEEEDADELKKQMENLRRSARGLPPLEEDALPRSAGKDLREKIQISDDRKLNAFSSTLTSLPPSDPPVSDHTSSSLEGTCTTDRSSTVEIMPKRKDRRNVPSRRGTNGASDHEDERDVTVRDISRRHLGSSSPLKNQDEEAESDDDEDKGIDTFWADIAGDSTRKEVASQNEEIEIVKEGLSTTSPEDLFGDDVEEKLEVRSAKGKKSRPLSKKDMRAMQSGLAENRRNRAVEVNKLSGNYLPMTSYMLEAVKVLGKTSVQSDRETKKGLDFSAKSSPKTSPNRIAQGDDIIAFTPSSEIHAKQQKTHLLTESMNNPNSSPTPPSGRGIRASTVVPSTSDAMDYEDEEADLPTMDDIFDNAESHRHEEKKREERLRALAAAKEAALKRRPNVAKQSQSDDDEFEIVREVKLTNPADLRALNDRSGPNAKAILNRNVGSVSPRVSRNKQIVMRHAGKVARTKESLTETFVNFAGKAFNHPGMKLSNGGAVPAGQKKGRESAITQAQLDAMMRRQHLQQAEKVRRQKEEAWGRSNMLPKKKGPDMEALIAASANHNLQDEVSEDEDDDFVPDDENDEDVKDEGQDGPQYSGEEDENEDDDDDEDVDEVAQQATNDQDVQNSVDGIGNASEEEAATPSLELEEISTDSDINTPRPARPSTKMVTSAASTLQSDSQLNLPGDGPLGFGGFDGDGGGFSQLFEPTQTSGKPPATDAFAGLRSIPNALQVDAFLPHNVISDTQAARDNALIAGEIEAAIETQPIESQQKKLYMNEHGKLTQTEPASVNDLRSVESQMASMRQILGGPSDLLSDIAESPAPFRLSSTQKGTSEAAPDTSSPTTTPLGLGNLLRRQSSPDDDGSPLTMLPVKRHEESVNARLMRQARRAEAKKAAVKSNLIDNQAEESDEDGGWTITGSKEDEDDEGQDEGYIPDLVDDQAIDEDEKKRQDELAAAKLREIEQADDAKREAEARKITEGQYRNKKRGADFFSDDEDDELGGKRKRWSKKERRKRRLDREDGLEKLEGEENAFRSLYEAGLDSDFSDDEPEIEPTMELDPAEETLQDTRPAWLIIRERAQMNRGRNLAKHDDDLDKEIGLDDTGFNESIISNGNHNDDDNDDDLVMANESQFSISRSIRPSTSINLDDKLGSRKLSVQRSTDSYAQFVQDESQMNRRIAGAVGVSVVVKQNSGPTATRITNNSRAPSRQSTTSSMSNSVLRDRGERFE